MHSLIEYNVGLGLIQNPGLASDIAILDFNIENGLIRSCPVADDATEEKEVEQILEYNIALGILHSNSSAIANDGIVIADGTGDPVEND